MDYFFGFNHSMYKTREELAEEKSKKEKAQAGQSGCCGCGRCLYGVIDRINREDTKNEEANLLLEPLLKKALGPKRDSISYHRDPYHKLFHCMYNTIYIYVVV